MMASTATLVVMPTVTAMASMNTEPLLELPKLLIVTLPHADVRPGAVGCEGVNGYFTCDADDMPERVGGR